MIKEKLQIAWNHYSHRSVILIFIALLLSVFNVADSQTLISNALVLKPGIYRTFEEFRTNSPSVPLKWELKVKSFKKKYFYCRILIKRKEAHAIGKVFGICNGNSVYINDEDHELSPKQLFYQVRFYGKYCRYSEQVVTSVQSGQYSHNVIYMIDKILFIENGEHRVIVMSTLEDILILDQELLDEYKNDKDKMDKLEYYFNKFLEKHKNDSIVVKKQD